MLIIEAKYVDSNIATTLRTAKRNLSTPEKKAKSFYWRDDEGAREEGAVMFTVADIIPRSTIGLI